MLVTVTVWATTIGTVLCGPAAGAQGPPPGPAALTGATVSLAPSHDVTVSGAGVVTFPAFSPDVSRYGITTTEATGGSVTLTASTSDPAGRVMVNGRLTDGSRTLSGLTPGDEIAVFIEDSAGIARHTFIYLPTGFPELVRTTPDPAPGSLHTGAVLLTLSQWVRPTPPALDSFETAVDVNGVPLFTRPGVDSLDLARQPDGHFTVFRANSAPGRTGDELVVLDDRMEPVTTRRTVGLTNTDGHDAILLPDGTAWLMAYEPRNPDGSGPVDAVIQRVDPDGSVGFQWSSAPYLAESDGCPGRLRARQLDAGHGGRGPAGVVPPPQLGLQDRDVGARRLRARGRRVEARRSRQRLRLPGRRRGPVRPAHRAPARPTATSSCSTTARGT